MFDSLRGQFLIAAKTLRDPNFYQSVVLMVEHNDEGAMGLVVNRPSSVTVAHALSEHFELPETDDVVFLGGPVQPSALFILHNQSHLDPDEPCILPGLYVGSSGEAFETLVRSVGSECPQMKFRIFCGCAGWGPGQLESEIARGDWFHLSADADTLFSENPYEMWDNLRRRVHRRPELLPDLPGQPEWN